MPNMRTHWDQVYASKEESGLSWFQDDPATSLALIHDLLPDLSAPIIDIGGGRSRLAAALRREGARDVTVLDISAVALGKARASLDETDAGAVAWIAADITSWQPPRRYALWHDRAVFHFLIETAAQDAYLAALAAGTDSGSRLVIAAFAPDGPTSCSGLPVHTWSTEALAERLGGLWRPLASRAEWHRTPWGAEQSFIYSMFRRI